MSTTARGSSVGSAAGLTSPKGRRSRHRVVAAAEDAAAAVAAAAAAAALEALGPQPVPCLDCKPFAATGPASPTKKHASGAGRAGAAGMASAYSSAFAVAPIPMVLPSSLTGCSCGAARSGVDTSPVSSAGSGSGSARSESKAVHAAGCTLGSRKPPLALSPSAFDVRGGSSGGATTAAASAPPAGVPTRRFRANEVAMFIASALWGTTVSHFVERPTALYGYAHTHVTSGEGSGDASQPPPLPTMQRCFAAAVSLLGLPDDGVLRGVFGVLANLCAHPDAAGIVPLLACCCVM
jgi:hypothetical protein